MPELVPLKVAQEHIGVSKTTMGKLAKEGRFTVYEDPRDRRRKLVDLEEVERAMQPRPIHGPEGEPSGRSRQ